MEEEEDAEEDKDVVDGHQEVVDGRIDDEYDEDSDEVEEMVEMVE